MERETSIVEELSRALSKARQEYSLLSGLDLIRQSEEGLSLYFRRLGMLRKLIESIESFIDDDNRMNTSQTSLIQTSR